MADTTPPSPPERQTLVLVDAHGLIFQLFHAVGAMSAPDGRPTNAVFGFVRDLFYLRDELKPTHLVYTLDPPGPTFREKLSTDYKAHRTPPPDDLLAQIPLIIQMLTAANVPVLTVPGYEADDVIATLSAAGAKRGMDVLICSTDKDCRQLIGDTVKMLSLRKRIVLDRAGLKEDWGVTPEQAIDYQALVGDSVDNVPGVKGVGPKTATKLLQQFGSIDAMLPRLAEVAPARIQEAIKTTAATGQLELSRKLVRLDTAVPIPLAWDAWKVREPDHAKLLALFQEWGFRSFAARMREALKPAEKPKTGGDLFSDVPDYEVGEFSFGANAPATTWKAKYELIDTPAKFARFRTKLGKQKRFAIDTETTGLDPLASELVGIAIAWEEAVAYYLPVKAPEGDKALDSAETLAKLKPILEDPAVAKVNQNIKFDRNVFLKHGVRLAGIAGDPMLADYLLRSGERGHNLDEMSERYLGHTTIPITDLIGKKGKNQITMAQVPTAKVATYAGEDADVAWRLTGRLEGELQTENLKKLYDDLEVPLIEVLADLEYTGIRLDVPFLAKLSAEMEQQLAGIEVEIHKLAGRPFNIASPKQLATVLFNDLKLPVQKKTDLTGAASTDQETLLKLAALGHALPKKIIEHRQISKLKGTYVDALPALVNPQTGRVHTSFNQAVTSTGRLSGSEPNLQNIPARTDQGRQIRQAFLPQEGWQLLTADYSQIELRLLAHFCGDEALRKAFAEDRDIHASVAAEIYGVPENDVTSAQRRVAKTVNFGILYGMSAFGLAERLSMPKEEAAKFIDTYFARYPKVLEYQTNVLGRCRKLGYVGTILGRRRKFDPSAIRFDSDYRGRNQAEREAINMEIQGSAADLLKTAMLNVHRRLKAEKRQARMLLTVHDELVFEVPPGELKALAVLAREEMNGAMTLAVPLKVDVSAGPNWLDVAEVA